MAALSDRPRTSAVVGLTGTGGAGKSSLLDELMLPSCRDNPEARRCAGLDHPEGNWRCLAR